MLTLTEQEIEALAANIGHFSPEEQKQIAVIIDELDRRKQARACQTDLLEFCKHMDPTYVVAPHHKKLAELLQQIAYGQKDRIAVSIPPRHGKLCADSTPILTPSGWKTHGELVVGDLVYGPDGVPIRVLAISEPGVASVEFEFSNGDTIKVHENHEWTMFYKPTKQWMTLESREFSEPMRDPRGQGRIRAVWTGKRGERGSKALWKLPKISPIQCQTKELPLDPYVFGVWLGDGTAGKTSITMGTEDFEYVLPAFQEAGWGQSATFVHKDTGVPTVSFGSGRMGVKSAFKVALEATGACYVKRIPEVYKRSSVDQRLALLAGLIDTDGHVELGSSRVRIVTVSKALAEDIAEIATTLGFAPYTTTQEPALSSSGIQGREVVYTVGFQPRRPVPTRIPRKKITGEVRQDRDPSLIEVRKSTNPEVGRCIQVDRDDGLYLVGRNLTPTHNSHLVSTLFPAWFLGKFPEKKVLMVSHTGDLAVDFGRKVRNMIADPRYAVIFPGITLAADSKSAGRWSTNRGGEYFACLRRYALVSTVNGLVPAGQIQVGDILLNSGQPVKVLEIYNSTHNATYRVVGLDCSADHPIWTMNRGWVPAAKILSSDILRVESISDKLKALFRRAYGYLEHPCVPSLVQHQEPLHQPEERKISSLRGAWHFTLRALAIVRGFLGRYEAPAFACAYSGACRQQRTIQPRELSMGDAHPASEQQAHERANRGQDVSGACSGARDTARDYSVPFSEWYGPAESCKTTQEELRAYSPPKKLGWLANTGASLLTACCRSTQSTQPRDSVKGYMAGFREATQELCGLLLGVRFAGSVNVVKSDPAHFVNFLTDGDHTFFADEVLTHNCGVGAALAGRGADLLLVDDPHSEQDLLAGNFDELEKTYQWFAFGARTRLMSGGRVAVVHTRWHQSDLIGHLIKDGANNPKADQYEVFEFPAVLTIKTPIYNADDEEVDEEVTEKALWPEKFDLEALERTRASMPAFQWNAQYMQNPTGEQGAIIQRDWWKPWKKEDPPECEYIIMALDAAAEKNNRADYTALLTFGVFSDDNLTDGASHIILLNAINIRVEFPELKDLAIREWKEWQPDSFIVEKKSSGTPLYQELRRMGIPVQEFTPNRGTGDKIARLNAVADILRSGMVWYPEGRRWAEDVIEQSVAFPYGSHDDMCFVAGTTVEMADGTPCPIEQVVVGQYVKTPLGPKRVRAAGHTGHKPTWKLVAGKTQIEGTAGHRIATSRGWTPLDSVRLSDRIKMSSTQRGISWPSQLKKMLSQSLSFLTGVSITGTQNQQTQPIVDTLSLAAGGNHCIGLFGNTTTVQYQMAGISTIKTVTGITTTSQILSASPQKNTVKNTNNTRLSFTSVQNILHILNVSDPQPPNGTEVRKAVSGIRTMLQKISKLVALDELHLRKHEKNAAKTRLNSLVLYVKNRLKHLFLGLNFARTRVRVVAVESTGETKPVFNISVEDAECYYANGVLVHNCDCLSMALTRFRQGGFVTLPSDYRDPEYANRSRRVAYY